MAELSYRDLLKIVSVLSAAQIASSGKEVDASALVASAKELFLALEASGFASDHDARSKTD